jgi:hypothetical protein
MVVAPFLYASNNTMDENVISYSVVWPIKDIQANDTIFRDYLWGLDE